jgi:FkbM family methyltransferase
MSGEPGLAHRVLAFEPDPVNCSQLAKNASLNANRNLVIVNEAVGDRTGEARFSNDHHTGFTTGGRIVDPETPHAFTVKMIAFDDLFVQYRVQRCGLLKLDCEGSEFSILHSAPPDVLDRIDQMVIEVHAPDQGGRISVAGLAAHLTSRGFRTARNRGLLWAWR